MKRLSRNVAAVRPLEGAANACYGTCVAEPPDSPVSVLQNFAKRARVTIGSVARALRRVSLFREALQIERVEKELRDTVKLFLPDTDKIVLDDVVDGDNEPPKGQAEP